MLDLQAVCVNCREKIQMNFWCVKRLEKEGMSEAYVYVLLLVYKGYMLFLKQLRKKKKRSFNKFLSVLLDQFDFSFLLTTLGLNGGQEPLLSSEYPPEEEMLAGGVCYGICCSNASGCKNGG